MLLSNRFTSYPVAGPPETGHFRKMMPVWDLCLPGHDLAGSACATLRDVHEEPGTLATSSIAERQAFVRQHTLVAEVPLVPEVRIYTATDVTPLWRATQAWLGSYGLDAPFWSVPWAGGQALARWVLDHPEAVRGLRVIDFGAGSGLVGIACALAGAASVRAVDIDPLAEAACLLNAEANRVDLAVTCADIVDREVATLGADVLLAGDVWYERAAAARFAPWLATVADAGVRVITGDPGRAYVPSAVVELARLDVPTCADLESTTTRLTRVLELR
jgi:predicted nicotinamide N-methyase